MRLSYSATITYRIAGDQTPPEKCPTAGLRKWKTETDREADVLSYCRSLENQPTGDSYEIVRVERTQECATCDGSKTVRVKPKNWRRKALPPWYMMREIVCPDCA